MYQLKKTPRLEDISINGLRYRVNTWGERGATPLFLLHGWMDTGMTFQGVVDAFTQDWLVIAPDWRGFGDTEWSKGGYWFPDYLADLDALINFYSPSAPVRIAGHSMGGNVCWLYAGIRPERVSHAISIDVFGLQDTAPELAPVRYRQWLDQLLETQQFAEYENIEHVKLQLNRLAPGIDDEYAGFIAEQWSKQTAGKYLLRGDPKHKRVNPVLYRREEARSCWRNITARTCLILAKGSKFHQQYYEEGGCEDCRSCFNNLTEVVIEDSGHMLHWEQPRQLALEIEGFLLKE